MTVFDARQGATHLCSDNLLDTAKRNLLFLDEAAIVAELLGNDAIEVALLKGVALLDEVYRLDERSMGDVDLLVRRHEFHRATRILHNNGYEKIENHSRRLGEMFSYEQTFASPRGIFLDLHWAFDIPSRWSIPYDDIWARMRRTSLHGASVHRLARQDLILHAVIHAAKECYTTNNLRSLADLGRLAAQPSQFAALEAQAKTWGCFIALRIALCETGLLEGGSENFRVEVGRAVLQFRRKVLGDTGHRRKMDNLLQVFLLDTPRAAIASSAMIGGLYIADRLLNGVSACP